MVVPPINNRDLFELPLFVPPMEKGHEYLSEVVSLNKVNSMPKKFINAFKEEVTNCFVLVTKRTQLCCHCSFFLLNFLLINHFPL